MSGEVFDLAVVGSGFAGSILAMIARRLGLSVVLIERGRHPRFAIGESSTPLANLVLEEIADEFGLLALRPFAKWGSWRRERPDIGCGLKRGFTFYWHEQGRAFPCDPAVALARQLLVGASPHDAVGDTHWYRPDFDAELVRQARALGAEYWDEAELAAAVEDDGGMRLTGDRGGRPFAVHADFVIDASGPGGFLRRALRLPEKAIPDFPATQALYSHFTGVQMLPARFTPGTPPYPPEQAAVHHLFDGGWVWVLRFRNGITSAGVAATAATAERLRLSAGEPGWRNLLRELPSLGECFAGAQAVVPFVWQSRIAFQSAAVAGRRWALAPSAAGFVDPLLSTGIALTLLGIQRLGRLLKTSGPVPPPRALAEYAETTTAEFEAAARLIAALYGSLDRFERFKELSLLYFAAASYAETRRRLHPSEPAADFLLCREPGFGPQLERICRDGGRPEAVRDAIAAIDVAGLGDRTRDPWYPALTDDLMRNAAKVGATPAEIAAMLARCGVGVAPSDVQP